MRRRRGPRGVPAWLSLVLLAACARPPQGPASLELVGFQQDGSHGVSLNETLVFHFSGALERTSVNASSVRILDEQGHAARGRLRVDRLTLTFTPDLPLRADYSDGGFRPGEAYHVELGGFPRPDGIVSQDGAPLSATLHLGFRTASGGVGQRLFAHSLAERHPLLHVPRQVIGPLDAVELRCEYEGIDPGSLADGEFAITSRATGQSDPILLTPHLLENRADGARLALRPSAAGQGGILPVLEPGEWYLVRLEDRLRSLGGSRLELSWRGGPRMVVVRARAVEERVGFEGASRRSPEEPTGLDGTAHWPDDGSSIGLRYPAAAGDGRDGDLWSLGESGLDLRERNDVHATRLRVEPGSVLDLGARPGPVVLRSQGAMDVAGVLRRGVAGPRSEALEQALERAVDLPARTWDDLSDWLEEASESTEPWTILIAGGDLRVTGSIEVAGPLMLIAGGWVRVTGYVEASSVWKSPGGQRNVMRVNDVPLRIDAPEVNPLLRPLTLGVLTHAIRPPGGVESWLNARLEARAGAGSARVRFIGLRDGERPAQDGLRYEPVDDVTLLGDCQALRLLLLVEMPRGEGEPWDPPRIEAVDLVWGARRFE